MYPILFKIGSLPIYSYGFFIAIGFTAAIFYARREAAKQGIDQNRIMDLIFYIIISGIVASRLFYVGTTLDFYIEHPLDLFKLWEGGLVFYGGFIGALITAIVYLKKHHLPVLKVTDIAGPTLALGHSIARIGCFFAGCCYGKACNLPWAVTFTHPESLAYSDYPVPRHPTQLYESATLFIIFWALILLKRYLKTDGQLFWAYIFLYGGARIVIELFRGDPRGIFIFGLFSLSQTIGAGMAVLALFMLIYLPKRNIAKTKNA